MLADALIDGLTAGGAAVHDIGLAPTPVLYYAAHRLELGSGIMVTGSHNPAEYNGFKLVLDGRTLSGEDIQALGRRMAALPPAPGGGRRAAADVADDYCARVAGDIRLARPLRVALDAGNGAAGPVAARTLRACGAELDELYCDVDGDFPHHHPNPSDPANLADLRARVCDEGLDLGLALDGDGDRCGVVDDRGEILWADRQLMLHARDVLARAAGRRRGVRRQVLGAAAASDRGGRRDAGDGAHRTFLHQGKAARDRRRAGRRDERAPVLRRALVRLRRRHLRPAPGCWRSWPAPASRRTKCSPGCPSPAPRRRSTSRSPPTANSTASSSASRRRAEFPAAEVSKLDGVRADFADGFGLARASNTTPCVVARFEGRDPAALERIQAEFRAQMRAVEPELELPF